MIDNVSVPLHVCTQISVPPLFYAQFCLRVSFMTFLYCIIKLAMLPRIITQKLSIKPKSMRD